MEKWIFQPHPGHLCIANYCRFFLNTYVNGYIISTVGEYKPDSRVRDILGLKDEYIDVGLNRKYETMVFKAQRVGNSCCEYQPINFEQLDFDGYNDPIQARKGHYVMCEKWSNKNGC